ncbi:amidase [Pseudonocardia spinosispora]|uniref:amidase n=1 Tax=Pseudonocardia spinosispora TaxID=103441 RepID=UPI00040A0B42|nr:amidase [Pseudonocardia spinosispora]
MTLRTLTEAAEALRAGTTTSRRLTEQALAVADESDRHLGVYLHRFDEYALDRADVADAELAAGVDRGPLHGIPFGVKDILAMAEGPTTAQSLVLDPAWGAGKDAPVVARLKQAGAVITGKTSTMEFACGMPDDSKPFPVPRNPWDPATWPGGSSSGTGGGVASGMFFAGLGTDTGGSIRIPAAFCGITGLMPTFGRVPKSGCVPLGYSLDHIGPMARSAQDCAAVLEVIAGRHASDPDCVDAPFSGPAWAEDLTGLRVGVVRDGHFPVGSDPALPGAFDATVALLAESGASTTPVALPYWTEMITADIVTMCCEALAYHRTDTQRRWADYYPATRSMLARGALVSGADYVQAQRMRRVAQDALRRLFTEVDVVVCPTASVPAPPLDGYLTGGTDIMALFEHIHTGYWDSVGNPVLALPMGFTAAGMPLSVQVAGRPFAEAQLLRVGQVLQARTDWHLQLPEPVGDTELAA